MQRAYSILSLSIFLLFFYACKSHKPLKILADYHIMISLEEHVKPSYLQVKFPYYKPIKERPSSKSENKWINTYSMYQQDAIQFIADLNEDPRVKEAHFAVGVVGEKKVISSSGKRSKTKINPKN